MIDTVFFDFGGTLFYERRKIPEDETTMSGYEALRAKGLRMSFEAFREAFYVPYRERGLELARKGLEISLVDFTREILPRVGLEPTDENVGAHIWGRFQPHSVNNVMYEDTMPTLQMLKPKQKIGLISNAQPHGILWHLDQGGIKDYFDEIVISGAVGLSKPNPDIFRMAAESICSEPDRCMMVGDSPQADAMGAESAGMTGVVIDRTGRVKQAFPNVNSVTDMRQIAKWLS